MSDRDVVIVRSVELEKILKNEFGAQGTGLGQYAISVQHLLPTQLSQQLRWICSIRNKCTHESEFKLYDPIRFNRVCDEVKAGLNAIDNSVGQFSSHQNYPERNTQIINIPQFTIPDTLVKFECTLVPYFINTNVTFDCITGRVIHLKEHTYTTRDKNVATKVNEQKIWLQLQDGREEYAEFCNFYLQVRKGQYITIVCGNRKKNRQYVAVYIHELQKYFYNTFVWNSLLFGIHTAIGKLVLCIFYLLGGPAWMIFSLLKTLLNPIVGDDSFVLFWVALVICLCIPIIMVIVVDRMISKRFKAHVAKIFGWS
jgi:hypothetical protein